LRSTPKGQQVGTLSGLEYVRSDGTFRGSSQCDMDAGFTDDEQLPTANNERCPLIDSETDSIWMLIHDSTKAFTTTPSVKLLINDRTWQ
jgi:hypothetical protein